MIDDVSNSRLSRAVSDAIDPIVGLGFVVIDSDESGRGAHVHLSNGWALIEVVADWLEGELTVVVNTDGSARAAEDIVDLTKVKGLHLRRLGRSVSAEVLASQLQRVF